MTIPATWRRTHEAPLFRNLAPRCGSRRSCGTQSQESFDAYWLRHVRRVRKTDYVCCILLVLFAVGPRFVLALEWILPVALWVKRSRKIAVAVAIAFHLAIDWTMNLFLFHWIMILGLLSFLSFDDLIAARDFCLRVIGRARRDPDPAG